MQRKGAFIVAVPTQTELHRHVLEVVSLVKGPSSVKQVVERLTSRLSLTQDDLQESTPSGATRVRTNTAWAAKYLMKAGLLHRPARGQYEITDDGRAYLKEQHGEIALSVLTRMGDARGPSGQLAAVIIPISDEDVTPDQKIADGYSAYRVSLAEDLLESLQQISSDGFERLTVQLLERMRFGKGETVGRPGDGGIDGIINQDALGLEKIYIQAKRWSSQVGDPEIRNFSGSLDAQGATKGVFITTSNFSESAKSTARMVSAGSKTIRLIDGTELASLMIDHGVGVITKHTYEIKVLDENYFGEEN